MKNKKLNEVFSIKENYPNNEELKSKISSLLLEYGLGHVIDMIANELENPSNPGTQPMKDVQVLSMLRKLSSKLYKEE